MTMLPTRDNWRTWALVVSLGFNVGFVTAFSVGQYRHHWGRGETEEASSLPSLRDELNLTAEQREQMERLSRGLFEELDQLQRELGTQEEQLARMLAGPEIDQTLISSELDKIAAIQRTVQQKILLNLLEQRRLLRPEQREIFNQVIRRHINPRGNGSGNGMGRGSGQGHNGEPREGH